MPNIDILDPKKHANLKIKTGHGQAYGEHIHCIPVVAEELNKLVLEFPVCFIKDPESGQFGLYALSGLEPGENLLLKQDGWKSYYIPLHIRRQPFVAIQTAENKNTDEHNQVFIDLDNQRVNEQEGEAVFNEETQPTQFLNNAIETLLVLKQSITRTQAFIDTLLENDLIEAVKLDINVKDQTQSKRIDGLYSINEDNLTQLTPSLLSQLSDTGYLRACHLISASLGHFQKLVSLKNAKSQAEPEQ